MKKILLILAMVGMVAVGCTEGGVDDNIDNGGNNTEQPGNGGGNEDEIPTDKIVIEPTTIEVAAEASDYVVAVSSPCSWRATTENEWITIETKLGIDGKRELIFSVADSYELEPREGKILVSNSDEGLSAELVVTQKALVPEWSIDVETLHFEANGGEQTIEIVANFGEYQVTSEVDWITFEYQENGVVVKVPTSLIDEERSAEITISKEKYDLSKTITIVQDAQDANRLIYYTSSDNAVIGFGYSAFNESIVSNTYNDNRGVIFFDAPVTSIGSYAFRDCTSLTSITIPDSVTSIEYRAFSGCTSLTSVTIGNGVTEIGGSAFDCCIALESVTIGNSVTSIGGSAFAGCTSLTSVYITDIAAWCNISFGNDYSNPLRYAKNLYLNNELVTDLIIPDGATKIGSYAFINCDSLTSVTIPDSVTSIGDDAFCGCDSLTSVYITDIAAWCNISFGGYDSNPLSYAGNLYLNNELVTDLIIPDSITSIGYIAFRDCTSLTSITIPDSVTSIGNSAFEDCSSLTSVTIGNGVTEIGRWAFHGCTSLTSITIPDSVAEIGNYALYECKSLKSVTIGNGVTSIGERAFYGCNSLTEVYCKPTTPPAIYFYANTYWGIPPEGSFPFNSGMKIYVPRSSYEAYMQYSSISNRTIAQQNWYKYEFYIEPYDFE